MARFVLNRQVAEGLLSNAEKRLILVGYSMERAIKMSMKEGVGREYVRKGITHVASVEGGPPAVDTGRLRASISTNWSKSGMLRGKVGNKAENDDGVGEPSEKFTVAVGTNVDYAPFLEFGTSSMGARPFIRPVFDEFKGKIPSLIGSVGRGEGMGSVMGNLGEMIEESSSGFGYSDGGEED